MLIENIGSFILLLLSHSNTAFPSLTLHALDVPQAVYYTVQLLLL